jgi:hypothetical protein
VEAGVGGCTMVFRTPFFSGEFDVPLTSIEDFQPLLKDFFYGNIDVCGPLRNHAKYGQLYAGALTPLQVGETITLY